LTSAVTVAAPVSVVNAAGGADSDSTGSVGRTGSPTTAVSGKPARTVRATGWADASGGVQV
jgi:hypothetical protein